MPRYELGFDEHTEPGKVSDMLPGVHLPIDGYNDEKTVIFVFSDRELEKYEGFMKENHGLKYMKMTG